jgi:hypothetical protein
VLTVALACFLGTVDDFDTSQGCFGFDCH